MRLRAIIGVVVALAVALATAGGAAASPQAVLEDYQADGSIDGTYSVDDLRGALVQVQDTSLYGAFRDAVQAALNAQIGGFEPSGGSGSPPAPRTAPRSQPQPDSQSSASPDRGAAGGGEEPRRQEARGGVASATESEPGDASGAGEEPSAPATSERLVPRARAEAVPSDEENSADATARDISGLSAGRELPQPPAVTPGEGVPLVFLALSAAAGALLLAGIVSAAYRRGVRRHGP